MRVLHRKVNINIYFSQGILLYSRAVLSRCENKHLFLYNDRNFRDQNSVFFKFNQVPYFTHDHQIQANVNVH